MADSALARWGRHGPPIGGLRSDVFTRSGSGVSFGHRPSTHSSTGAPATTVGVFLGTTLKPRPCSGVSGMVGSRRAGGCRCRWAMAFWSKGDGRRQAELGGAYGDSVGVAEVARAEPGHEAWALVGSRPRRGQCPPRGPERLEDSDPGQLTCHRRAVERESGYGALDVRAERPNGRTLGCWRRHVARPHGAGGRRRPLESPADSADARSRSRQIRPPGDTPFELRSSTRPSRRFALPVSSLIEPAVPSSRPVLDVIARSPTPTSPTGRWGPGPLSARPPPPTPAFSSSAAPEDQAHAAVGGRCGRSRSRLP